MIERLVGPRVPELRAVMLDVMLRVRTKRHTMEVSDRGMRAQAVRFRESMKGAVTPPFVHVERVEFAGRPAEWVRADERRSGPANAANGAGGEKVVLYFHGGGFFFSSPEEHRPLIWRMAAATQRRVLAPEYRKAPDHAFPAWLDDAAAAYGELLARGIEPADIVVSGDSAGGNIALALVHRLRRTKVPLPDSLVLFSPWADVLGEARSFFTNRHRDAMFDGAVVREIGRHLTRHVDPRDPEVSPVHADFRGYPRMLVFAGATEVFVDDARAVARRAAKAGVEVELHVHRHMPHIFPIFAGVVPRAKTAFDDVRRFVARA